MPIEVIIMMIGMGLGAISLNLRFLNKINSLTISKIVHYGVYCNFQENDAIEGL